MDGCPPFHRRRDEHQPHRLLCGAAVGASDTGHRDTEIGTQSTTDALDHRPGDRLAHRASRVEQLLRDPEELPLYPVLVGDDATDKDIRAPRDIRQPSPDLTAGARLRRWPA